MGSKVTPLYTKDWYVKWIATFFMLLAVCCRGIEEVPKIYDVILSFIGTSGWLYVAMVWQDRALIVLDAVILFVLTGALIRYFLV